MDAIVNAANSALCGGGGVDGAIHRAAGPDLLAACSKFEGCEVGSAVLTEGYELPASHVIHAVGPVWSGGSDGEPALLASCYRTALDLATAHGFETLAFPAISCGAYRYPKDEAAVIAIQECFHYLSASELPATVRFCCVEPEVYQAYEKALAGCV